VTSRYRTKPRVHFEEFRILEQRRVAASNAIWAILAGSKIASNTLNLTKGSTRTLAEMFPTVEHIERFNLRSDEARGLLGDAEIDLCTMGMSYAIALHEDFVKTSLEWLLPLGLISRSKLRDAKTANVHEKLEGASGVRMDADSLVLFHMTRLMRNCHIHAGGSGSSHLEAHMRALSATQVSAWEGLTQKSFTVIPENAPVIVEVGELIATLAVGKRLAYEVNLCLQAAIPRNEWADRAAGEYFGLVGARSPKDPKALRSLMGYARPNFSALSLTEREYQDAIDRFKVRAEK
jgi:hypothetical protein